jgi:hypothetical protein
VDWQLVPAVVAVQFQVAAISVTDVGRGPQPVFGLQCSRQGHRVDKHLKVQRPVKWNPYSSGLVSVVVPLLNNTLLSKKQVTKGTVYAA